MGTDEDQDEAPFPPHKVVGNIYYVGTRTLSSFLITTPSGHILLNSTYERNVRTIEKSVTQLGFKFADVPASCSEPTRTATIRKVMRWSKS